MGVWCFWLRLFDLGNIFDIKSDYFWKIKALNFNFGVALFEDISLTFIEIRRILMITLFDYDFEDKGHFYQGRGRFLIFAGHTFT